MNMVMAVVKRRFKVSLRNMVRKLNSAPSPDGCHDDPRQPIPYDSPSYKRYDDKVEAISARRVYESVEQPQYPLDPNYESEYWSDSEHEPELEDVRNTPYPGQSHEYDMPERVYGGE